MAISIVGTYKGSSTYTGGADLVIAIDGGDTILEDDLVICYGACDSSSAVHVISETGGDDWTNQFAATSGSLDPFFGWKFMGASVDTSVSITNTANASNEFPAIVRVYRGVHLTDPSGTTGTLDALETVQNSDNTDLLPPAITTDETNCTIVILGCLDNYDQALIAPPTGYGNDDYQSGNGPANESSTAYIADMLLAAATTETPGIFDINGQQDPWNARTFALRPAAAGGIGIPIAMHNYRMRVT